jgi:hypothetical protein
MKLWFLSQTLIVARLSVSSITREELRSSFSKQVERQRWNTGEFLARVQVVRNPLEGKKSEAGEGPEGDRHQARHLDPRTVKRQRSRRIQLQKPKRIPFALVHFALGRFALRQIRLPVQERLSRRVVLPRTIWCGGAGNDFPS